MRILALDSSTEILSLCLYDASQARKKFFDIALDQGNRHAEILLELVDYSLKKCSLQLADITLFACARGPGSFTGLRIGYATCKGFALAQPASSWVTVPTMDFMSYGHDDRDALIVPIIDGKKARVYTALYTGGKLHSDYLDITPAALLELITKTSKENVFFTGPHASYMAEHAEKFQKNNPAFSFHIDQRASFPYARALAHCALTSYTAGMRARADEGPLYIRPSEAEED